MTQAGGNSAPGDASNPEVGMQAALPSSTADQLDALQDHILQSLDAAADVLSRMSQDSAEGSAVAASCDAYLQHISASQVRTTMQLHRKLPSSMRRAHPAECNTFP